MLSPWSRAEWLAPTLLVWHCLCRWFWMLTESWGSPRAQGPQLLSEVRTSSQDFFFFFKPRCCSVSDLRNFCSGPASTFTSCVLAACQASGPVCFRWPNSCDSCFMSELPSWAVTYSLSKKSCCRKLTPRDVIAKQHPSSSPASPVACKKNVLGS